MQTLSVQYSTWELASDFKPRRKGKYTAGKLTVQQDERREVWCREVQPTRYIHVGFDPEFRWLEKVTRLEGFPDCFCVHGAK